MINSTDNQDLFHHIEVGYKAYIDTQRKFQLNYGDWSERMLTETDRLLDHAGKIRSQNLVNFRGREIFISDQPVAHIKGIYFASPIFYALIKIINHVIGQRRGALQMALEQLRFLLNSGAGNLLLKYPISLIGNPLVVKKQGYLFTSRHLRHVYLLSLFNKYIKNQLSAKSIFMDIGSSYGTFTSLLKKEVKDSRHILVDSYGQLILAEYFLSRNFPDAKIAGLKEVCDAKNVDNDFISQYDFILIPADLYQKIEDISIDVVTNFLSLSEMSKEWFGIYINSKIFSNAKFFFTVNRYDAYPIFSSGINVIDYPFERYERILMRNCKFFEFYAKSFLLFFYKKHPYSSHFFEFIGKSK